MNAAVLHAAQEALESAHAKAHSVLAAIPGVGAGRMGLTPDHVRATPEWRVAHADACLAWARLRAFNGARTRDEKRAMAEYRRSLRKVA